MSLDTYIAEQAQVIAESVRLLHPKGSLCWQVGNHVQNGWVFRLIVTGNSGIVTVQSGDRDRRFRQS